MTSTPARDMWSVFLVAFGVRLAALVAARASGRFPGFWEYETIARHVLAGEGFVYRFMGIDRVAYIEPVYPLFTAAVYFIAGFRPTVLGVVQCAIAAAVAPVIYAFARRTFDRPSALASAVLVAVHPGLVGYATNLHALSFDALAIALVAFTLLRALDDPNIRHMLVLGVATGVGILTRPTILAFVAAAAIWPAMRRDRRAFIHVLGAVAIAAAVVAPWPIRNYAHLGTFVLTRSHVGFNFWLGNHPGATGGEGDPADPTGGRSLFVRAPAELRARVLAQSDEIAQDRVFWSDALAYVAREPLAFLGRTAAKFGWFWSFPSYMGRRYATAAFAVYAVYYVAAVALALAGAASVWRSPDRSHGHGIAIVVLMLLSVAVTQSLFYVQGRHRLGVEALLMVLSGHGIAATLGPRRSPT